MKTSKFTILIAVLATALLTSRTVHSQNTASFVAEQILESFKSGSAQRITTLDFKPEDLIKDMTPDSKELSVKEENEMSENLASLILETKGKILESFDEVKRTGIAFDVNWNSILLDTYEFNLMKGQTRIYEGYVSFKSNDTEFSLRFSDCVKINDNYYLPLVYELHRLELNDQEKEACERLKIEWRKKCIDAYKDLFGFLSTEDIIEACECSILKISTNPNRDCKSDFNPGSLKSDDCIEEKLKKY